MRSTRGRVTTAIPRRASCHRLAASIRGHRARDVTRVISCSPWRRERDDTDGADARERFVVGRRAGIERDVLRLHLRRVRDGEAVLRVGERSRTRLSSSRRARVRRVLRERGERVGDDDVRDARRRRVGRFGKSRCGARVRVSGWTRRGTERGVFDAWEGESEGGGWTGVGDGGENGGTAARGRGGDDRREREASGGFERGVDVRGGGRSVDVRLGE